MPVLNRTDSLPALAPSLRRWERLPGGSQARLTWLLCASAIAHLTFTPIAALLGALAWLVAPADQDPTPERLDGFVVELMEVPSRSREHAMPSQVSAPPGPGAVSEGGEFILEAAASAEPPPPRPIAEKVDALPEEVPKDEPPPPRPKRSAKPKPTARPPSISGDAPKRNQPSPPAVSDPAASPVDLSAVRGPARQTNARVNLLFYSERLRGHPLGARLGRLVGGLPQWQSFLGQARIDPIEQVDRLLLVGSSFRRTADVVAVVRHRLGPTGGRAAIEGLVQRPPRGRWLQQKPPVALAYADRAERLFVLSGPHTVMVGPKHLRRELVAASPVKFPPGAGKEALVLFVKSPRRTLGRLPVSLPESLKWLRVGVATRSDGGADVSFLAEDASAKAATQHAAELATALNALTNPNLGRLGALLGVRTLSFLDPLSLQAEGAEIGGELRVTLRQLKRLLTMLEGSLRPPSGSVTGVGRAPGAPSPR